MIKSLKDLLDKFSRFTNSLVYDGGICKRLLNKTDFPVYLKKCSSNHCKQCSNKSVNTVQVFLESVFKCERFLQ